MKPGLIGSVIPPHGQTEHYRWETSPSGLATEILWHDGTRDIMLASFFGPTPIRMERVLACIGYLEEECKAKTEGAA